MFLTTPECEQPLLLPREPEGAKYWLATVLSSRLPWYLLSHQVICATGHTMIQTVAISWESTLRSWIERVGPEVVTSLDLVAWTSTPGEWTLRAIDEVWIPVAEEWSDTGPMIFRVRGESTLWCSNEQPVLDENPERQLLVRIPRAGVPVRATRSET